MSQEQTIGERIKALRLKQGLSQKALGDLCIPRIDASHIRKIENGRTSPTAETLGRIANALQTSITNEYLNKIEDDIYKRESSEYIRYSILEEICERLNYECDRYEYNDAPEELEEDFEAMGLTEIEYVIEGKAISHEEWIKMFDRFIEHMAIDFKAFLEDKREV